MPKINRDGVGIYYEVYGEGPPLLLTHGYSSTSAMWHGQIDALARDHKLVLWDMRGHGQSDYPDDPNAYSEALTVGDMAAILDAVGTERAIIGGLSLGGVMSLAFHLAYPERVRALMLFDTGPGFRNPEARRQWNERAEARARDLEEKGLPTSVGGAETRLGRHRSAQGLAGAVGVGVEDSQRRAVHPHYSMCLRGRSKSGGYSFTMTGANSSSPATKVVLGGVFTANGGTGLSNVILDVNSGGTIMPRMTSPSQSFTAPDSNGRGSLIMPGGRAFTYYIISSKALRLLESDNIDLTGGSAYAQSATVPPLSGKFVFQHSGWSSAGRTIAAGQFSSNGSGSITAGVSDSIAGGPPTTPSPNKPVTGSYVVSGTQENRGT